MEDIFVASIPWRREESHRDFSEEDRQYDREVNDPIALGAMAIEDARTCAIDIGCVTAPALVYAGGNDQPEEARKTSDALGVELHVLPDLDHLEAFSRLDLVMPMVLGFLGALGL